MLLNVSLISFKILLCFISTACKKGQLKCDDQSKCVDGIKRCDGNADCQDNSDEINCGELFVM